MRRTVHLIFLCVPFALVQLLGLLRFPHLTCSLHELLYVLAMANKHNSQSAAQHAVLSTMKNAAAQAQPSIHAPKAACWKGA
jgi:hypothetical protein